MTSPYETAGRIRRAQASVIHLWPLVLGATGAGNNGDRVTTSKVAPAPVSAHLLDVRAEAQHHLSFYTKVIAEEVNHGTINTLPNILDPIACAHFIHTWALHLAEQLPHRAERCADHLERDVRTLAGLVKGDTTHRYQLGLCPEVVWVGDVDGELTRCTGMLWATMRGGDSMLPQGIACEVDGAHTWHPWQWRDLGRRITGMEAAS